jgi:hypothetical protein
MKLQTGLAGLAIGSLAACGGAMAKNDKPVLATITGSVTVTTPPPQGDEVRVALLWQVNLKTLQDISTKHVVAQDVAVTGETWPAGFTLAITDLPPADAIESGTAIGSVIAYRDLDHNGQLDFTAPDADGFADQILAYDSKLLVSYSQDGAGVAPKGFSLNMGSPIDQPIVLTDHSQLAASCYLLDWDLENASAAGASPWSIVTNDMSYCPQSPEQEDPVSGLPQMGNGDGSPPTDTKELACFTDPNAPNTPSPSYTAYWHPPTESPFISQTCGALARHCHALRDSTQGAAVPSKWPCPCDPNKYTCQ